MFECHNNLLMFVFCFNFTVNLVERNATPNGYELVNPNYVGKHNAFDLVTLATEIQNADIALNQHSGKLTLILDQVKQRFCTSQSMMIQNIKYMIFIFIDSFFAITSPSNTSGHKDRYEFTSSRVQF